MFNSPFAKEILGLANGAPPPAAPPMDLEKSHLTDARSIFREPSKVPQKLLAEKLVAARLRMFRDGAAPEHLRRADELIVRLGALEEHIEEFLHAHQTDHVTQLMTRREAMRQRARAAEDDAKAATLEAGRISGRLNFASQALSAARAKFTEVASEQFDTKFPNATEIAVHSARRSAAEQELRGVTAEYSEIQQALRTAQADQSSTSKKLRECVEELDAIDRSIASAQS